MNPQSIIKSITRFANREGNYVGMGTVISQRCVVTTGDVIKDALGLFYDKESILNTVVPFLVLSSTKTLISSNVVGWTPVKDYSEIAILAVSSEGEEFLSPASLMRAGDTDFYSGCKR
jgi:hypothetical protein